MASFTYKQPPVAVAIDPVRPGFKKLCEPLAEWRDDAPESFPFCTACGATIRVGMPYAIAWPLSVLCLPCSGIRPRKR